MGDSARFLVIPCEAPDSEDLAVIWDRVEEQVIDVITTAEAAKYVQEDSL